jgi:hypothetical protein
MSAISLRRKFKTRRRERVFAFAFNPCAYLTDREASELRRWLHEKRGWEGETFSTFHVYKSRGKWWAEIPHSFFANQLTDVGVSQSVEIAARTEVFERVKKETGSLGFTLSKALRYCQNLTFYDQEVFYTLRAFMKPTGFFAAVLHLLGKLSEKDSAALALVCPRQRRIMRAVDRPSSGNYHGHGPAWSISEDSILGRWFGCRADGKHHALTGAQWHTLLDAQLNGVRTKTAVLARLTRLNYVMKLSLLVEGYLPRQAIREYRRRFLGQRFRMPSYRPRPGYHHPIVPKKRRKQPETTIPPPIIAFDEVEP